MHVLVLYNIPSLPASDPDYAQEAGVLETVAAIDAALTSHGWRTEPCGLASIECLSKRLLSADRPDVVFNLCEGFGGRGEGESQIAELLEKHGVPFTGSPSQCLAETRDKPTTKQRLLDEGLSTPTAVVIRDQDALHQSAAEQLLQFGPVIVKPATEDASLGINQKSVCHDWKALAEQVEHMRQDFDTILIEQFVAGREFNVAIVALPNPRVLPIAEILFDETLPIFQQLVTYEAKWVTGSVADRTTPVRCPADISPRLRDAIVDATLTAFSVLGCRDYARVDIRVDNQERLFILEVNANPDISPSAGFASSLDAAGVEFDDFVVRVVKNALRHDLAPL
jgi:D-alanine-D-alanine ligase